MNTPEILYHGSTVTGLASIQPALDEPNHPELGPCVFATADKRVAAMFLAPRDGGPISVNVFGDSTRMIIQNTPEAYAGVDRGGTIYVLPAQTFAQGTSGEFGATEWVSHTAVTPIASEVFSSSLEAMRSLGVYVYLVDVNTFHAIQASDDHGLAIIDSLTPYRS